MFDGGRYTIGELADLGGVSRRTVRYYVQERLISAPHGLGRGAHYAREHLDQLLLVKAMQEAGMTLEAIRREVASGRRPAPSAEVLRFVPRSHWTRIELLPGVELHVSSQNQVPSPGSIEELVEWCRRRVRRETEEEHG